MIAFFTMGWAPSPTAVRSNTPITITTFGTTPVPFTTSGAFVTSGTRYMTVRHSGNSQAGVI
ncbi:MAG: hypothetical protein M3O67_09600, partial [Bacteroidota bacterium]|nr:hypothetical protein [Bacteroidota bacterium]